MSAPFALGNRASVDDILARLVDPPSYSTVRVMLTRLEKKGYLQHTQEGLNTSTRRRCRQRPRSECICQTKARGHQRSSRNWRPRSRPQNRHACNRDPENLIPLHQPARTSGCRDC